MFCGNTSRRPTHERRVSLLVMKEKLPKLDTLVPLSFIGQAAVTFYRNKIKLMNQLEVTEEQRKATLQDG